MLLFYLMAIVGIIGILAKVVTRFTVRRLVRAAAAMQKSTHKLMKLVRSKYEHACMAHDRVDNTEVFVDKFLFEYRTLGLRLHTWQMLQRQSIWYTMILAVIGAGTQYYGSADMEMVYRYAISGIAQIVLLTTLYQLSDEKYRLNVVKVYMVDYLENIHAHRSQKLKQSEKEKLNVINPEAFTQPADKPVVKVNRASVRGILKPLPKGRRAEQDFSEELDLMEAEDLTAEDVKMLQQQNDGEESEEKLSDMPAEEGSLRVDAIRHILEEFLA